MGRGGHAGCECGDVCSGVSEPRCWAGGSGVRAGKEAGWDLGSEGPFRRVGFTPGMRGLPAWWGVGEATLRGLATEGCLSVPWGEAVSSGHRQFVTCGPISSSTHSVLVPFWFVFLGTFNINLKSLHKMLAGFTLKFTE